MTIRLAFLGNKGRLIQVSLDSNSLVFYSVLKDVHSSLSLTANDFQRLITGHPSILIPYLEAPTNQYSLYFKDSTTIKFGKFTWAISRYSYTSAYVRLCGTGKSLAVNLIFLFNNLQESIPGNFKHQLAA